MYRLLYKKPILGILRGLSLVEARYGKENPRFW